ncbi:MAG: glutamine amidotransferase [Bifidobacteriaceae bacterium]|jgi:CobQ-like glutamine amidotransferase family enzyme|nr:glutamine amidotransferase [Bifidobacteriaceae bacterium]
MNAGQTIAIVHLFPTLMGTYGDGGNLLVLARRAKARGLTPQVVTVGPGDAIPAQGDLYVLGGGEDAGQVAAARYLRQSAGFKQAAEAGACIFAVCAGLQVLGTDFEVAGGAIEPGVGLLDAVTRRREPRAVGEVWAEVLPEAGSAAGLPPLTGYENHGGGTALGPAARPLARVVSGIGNGSGGPAGDGTEGVVQGHVLATYLHGPVLARNPELADRLLSLAAGGATLPDLATPYVADLRQEREAYVRSGKLSADSVRTRR